MEYYNIRNSDMGRNVVWDMSRDDVWDMSRDVVWDLGNNDVCCGYCGERDHTHSECKHGTHQNIYIKMRCRFLFLIFTCPTVAAATFLTTFTFI
jgi:hypothetical protein